MAAEAAVQKNEAKTKAGSVLTPIGLADERPAATRGQSRASAVRVMIQTQLEQKSLAVVCCFHDAFECSF